MLLSDDSMRTMADISLIVGASEKSTSFYKGQGLHCGALLENDFHMKYGVRTEEETEDIVINQLHLPTKLRA